MAQAKKQSILILEDDHDIRVTVRENLEHEGYDVLTATNGKDGIEALRKTKPSLVLLDLLMPIMDGYEFLKLLRSEPDFNRVPVVVMTASGVSKPPEGAAALYHKPFELRSLLAVANQYCQQQVG